MSDKALATQAGIGELKTILAAVSDNLYAHVNQSLSESHGINTATGPADDGNGNDLSVYQDSNGDLVGPYFVRMTVNNTVYYVPAQATSLAGRNPDEGVVVTGTPADTVGQSALITEYVTQSGTTLYEAEDTFLTPHVKLGHWETHAGMTAATENVLDSAGHTVGTTGIRMVVGGFVYKIPASARVGGPIQPPRNYVMQPTVQQRLTANENDNLGDTDQIFNFSVVDGDGTKPVTIRWDVNLDRSDPNALDPNYPAVPPPGSWVELADVTTPQDLEGDQRFTISVDRHDIQVKTTNMAQVMRRQGWIRARIVGAGGTVYTNVTDYCVKDKDSSWVCSRTLKTMRKAGADLSGIKLKLARLKAYALAHNAELAAFYLGPCEGLAVRMDEKSVDWLDFAPFIRELCSLVAAGRMSEAVSVYIVKIKGFFDAYWPDCPHEFYRANKHKPLSLLNP